jgi:hypothetical protein
VHLDLIEQGDVFYSVNTVTLINRDFETYLCPATDTAQFYLDSGNGVIGCISSARLRKSLILSI